MDQPSTPVHEPSIDAEEVSLLDYLAVLVNHLRLIVLIVVVTVATAVVGVLVMTPTYTAITTILPTKAGGGNPLAALGEVAGLTGLSGLAGGAAEGSSQLFPQILRSRSLLEKVVTRRYRTKASPDSATLIEIFKMKKKSETEQIETATKRLRGQFQVTTDPKTGIVTISVEAEEPQLAATIANAMVEELKTYNQNVRTSRAKENRIFIEKRLAETDEALKGAEETLKVFRERNRMFDAPELQLVQGRLTREVTIQQEIFITLKKQHELAKIEEIKETPVVNVLDPAIAPLLRTKPKRRQTVMLAGVVSLFLGVFFAFALQYTENVKRDGGSAAKLGAMREAVRRQMRW